MTTAVPTHELDPQGEQSSRGARFFSGRKQGTSSQRSRSGSAGLSDQEFGELLAGAGRANASTPEQVGEYRLIRELGAGGMGKVYEAEHVRVNRRCAVKLILPELTSNRRVLMRFEREVQTMASLSHWNTVRVFDHGATDAGQFYYVMELLDGITFDELVCQEGPLSATRMVHYMAQVCDALAEAHRAGLVHRDLKPGNLMTACVGGIVDVAKVLDFGLVRNSDQGVDTSNQVTQVNYLCGTPKYMAPEQVMDASTVDCRADVYSLGATAYYLLTGQAPFQRPSGLATAMAHIKDPVIRPSTYNPLITPRLESVILKCMAKSPDNRFQDTLELKNALVRFGL